MLTARRLRALALAAAALAGCRSAAPPAATPGAPPLFATFPGHDPRPLWDERGNLHVVYVVDGPDGGAVTYRRLGTEPAGPVAVSPPGVSTGAHGEFAPVVAALPGGALVAAYPAILPGRWKSELKVQRSTDGGATWDAGRLPHPQRIGTHSFASAAVDGQGKLVLAWLDDRSGHMGLYAGESADGAEFSASRALDEVTCECCGTALLARHDGSLVLAYRDVTPEHVRDFQVLRSSTGAGGFTVASPLSHDGWVIPGCPDTGARLAETGGELWAVWFTVPKGGPAGLYIAVSRDGGAHFGPRELLATGSRRQPTVRHPELGVLPDGRLAVLYEGVSRDGDGALWARLRDPRSGRWGTPRRLTDGGTYPRLAVAGHRVAVAFTCPEEQGSRVVVAGWERLVSKGGLLAGCSATPGPTAHHGH